MSGGGVGLMLVGLAFDRARWIKILLLESGSG